MFGVVLNGNSQDISGYSIENDSIIFVFDARDYQTYTVSRLWKTYDNDDIDIESVSVAGEFNDWAKDKWKLTKTGQYTYRLAKHLDDFIDRFSWDFKFVVNDKYWAEPNQNVRNIAKSKPNGRYYIDANNLRLFTSTSKEEGNICFTLDGFEDAEKIVLSGTFNYWNEQAFVMTKTESGWEISIHLKPGFYEYKFIVDGEWITDPKNPNVVENEFSEYNSYLDVLTPVTFSLHNYADAEDVYLAGSFNDWHENSLRMEKTDTAWTLTLDLIGGKHHYKFIVDGEWILDPDNALKEYDYDGNINSVLMVR